MRVDEGGRKEESPCFDDAMLVRIDLLPDLGDDAVVDPHVERRIDALDRIDDSSPANDDVRSPPLLDPEHQATSAAASARTPTGPVSTS
jgi:hypothetical protein